MDSKLALAFKRHPNLNYMPPHTKDALAGYFFYGYQPGGFLTAMLTKDLTNAVFIADVANRGAFVDIFKWISWMAPPESWGSLEVMKKWIKLTDEQRRTILVRCELANSVFEIISSKEETNVDHEFF